MSEKIITIRVGREGAPPTASDIEYALAAIGGLITPGAIAGNDAHADGSYWRWTMTDEEAP